MDEKRKYPLWFTFIYCGLLITLGLKLNTISFNLFQPSNISQPIEIDHCKLERMEKIEKKNPEMPAFEEILVLNLMIILWAILPKTIVDHWNEMEELFWFLRNIAILASLSVSSKSVNIS